MAVQDLINEYAMLNDMIYQLRNQILEEEIKKIEYESNLWLNTDFKALKLTNKELRDAYVDSKMGLFISNVGSLKNDLKSVENELELCKLKIRLIMSFGDFKDVDVTQLCDSYDGQREEE